MNYLAMTTLVAFLGLQTLCLGQEKPDNQYFEIAAQGLEAFHLHNMHGDVEVRGTNASQIKVTVRRELRGGSASDRASYYYDTLQKAEQIYFFMRSPNHDFKIEPDGQGYYNSCCNWGNGYRESVKYTFEVTVEVPENMQVYVSNHHDALTVVQVNGDLVARNHHKDLVVSRIGGNAQLNTHHGDIKASFTRNPTDECSFNTHHGDIRITYQDWLSADVKLSSRHGEFFTDFDWESRPLTVTKASSSRGTKYKVGDGTYVTIGGGGPLHQFTTWHGDIYLEREN